MKTVRHEPGAFVRIPLSDGTFAYGRQLEDPYTAFYDYRTPEPSTDLDMIEANRVLFTQAVRAKGLDRWQRIGARELAGEIAEPVTRFHQEIGDFRKCTIYDTLGNEKAATPEECAGLERAAVWDAHHIEERLLDAFECRPNETELRARVRMK